MKNDVRLYINDELVDMSDELSMPFMYQLEDTNNPTIIKNSFTKTITIVGTKQNNKIFGEIYELDREQLYNDNYLTGVYFNPSYRTPFKIYKNGELIESGYMQLNTITIKNKIINYNITLYGGIGDFFYNLSYNKENESLQLKDLIYGVEDENGNVIAPEKEFDFKITKEFVKKCWNNIDVKNNQIEDFINFAPSYNGLYENFDNNKVLINTSNCDAFTVSATTVDNVKYTTYSGYAMADLNKDYTEWEMRDLRSYEQRPVIKLKKVIEACCNPTNNGGYKVDLDLDFFNSSNPYWENSYIALPLLSTILEDREDSQTITSDGITYTKMGNFIGNSGGTYQNAMNFRFLPTGDDWVIDDFDYIDYINTNNLNVSALFDAEVDLQIFFKSSSNYTPLYPSTLVNGKSGSLVYNNYPIYQSIVAQILVYSDSDLMPIAYSNIYNFTNKLPNGGYSSMSNWTNYWNFHNAPVTNVFGHFEYSAAAGKHYFLSDDDSNTFKIRIENVKKYDRLTFVLNVSRASNDGIGNETSNLWRYENTHISNIATNRVYGYWDSNIFSDSKISAKWSEEIITGEKITKSRLLKTENTPSDYLLSFAKLFGLHFRQDIGEKKIYIETRSKYFQNITENWEDRIDWSKDVIINPILFDKKFYKMSLDSEDNFYLKRYNNDYGVNYGQKRINTAYNFNTETQNLYDKNVFQNAISVTDTSIYYRTFYNSGNTQMPAFAADGLKYKLYSGDTTTDIEMNNLISPEKSVAWNSANGYDIAPKTAFFTVDGDKKSLSDISSCLLFYNGNYTPKNIGGGTVQYWLTDDILEMINLNDGKACYIYTETPYSKDNRFIAYPLENIPQFLRHKMGGNTVNESWDFAVPKETYIPNLNYDGSTTIYDRFWDNFYADQLNINTKKLTAYVNLEGLNINNNTLRKFYWFGNSYWILNKIYDYDVNKWGTTKCEFIKVNEINNYIKSLSQNNNYFSVDRNNIVVDYNAGTYKINVQSSTDWEVFWYNSTKITSISPSSGKAGNTEVTINYTANENSYEANYFYFTITNQENERISIDFKQTPNPETTAVLHGVIKYSDGTLLPEGRIVITDAVNTSLVYDTVYADDYTGEYKVYIPRDKSFRAEIQANINYGNDEVYSIILNIQEDRIYNFYISK
jgi:hypothetical protein